MARAFMFQGRFPLVVAVQADPNSRQLFALPFGFRGSVRVKFQGAAAGDFMFAMWAPITTELRGQNAEKLSATNYGIHFADTNEKQWDFPPDGAAFMAFCSAAAGFAVVDVAGVVEDQRE